MGHLVNLSVTSATTLLTLAGIPLMRRPSSSSAVSSSTMAEPPCAVSLGSWCTSSSAAPSQLSVRFNPHMVVLMPLPLYDGGAWHGLVQHSSSWLRAALDKNILDPS